MWTESILKREQVFLQGLCHDNQVITKPEVSLKKKKKNYVHCGWGNHLSFKGVKNKRDLHLERIQSRFNPVLWVFGPEKRAIYRSWEK